MHAKGLQREQDEVLGMMAKHLLSRRVQKGARPKKPAALGIQGSPVATASPQKKDPSYSPEHPEECCPSCGARLERGDDGRCNRCGEPWPLPQAELEKALAKVAALEERARESSTPSDPKALYDDVRKMLEGS